MNKKVRSGLKRLSIVFSNLISSTTSSIVSLLRMILLSRFRIAMKSEKYKTIKQNGNCTVLANGPSLKYALDAKNVMLEGNDVLVVNMFVQSPEFWTIKPRFYFLSDNVYFAPQNERHNKLVTTLVEEFKKIDWEMKLCVPSSCISGGVLVELNNPHIEIIKWNTATFEGYKWLCHFMFRHNMAMPRCQTVTNFALVAAINMKYENVYLYGADHGWTKDLRVDDDNVCCYGDRHVYSTGLTIIKLEYGIATLLRQYAKMFESHHIINDYAKALGVKIWNCTKGSFVDAYARLNNN